VAAVRRGTTRETVHGREHDVSDPATPARDDLPLSDYDHIPTGSLAGRIRSLDAGELKALLAYERAHADRPAEVQLIESRLDEVEAGAEPSDGSPDARRPEVPEPAPPEPAARPETQGPPVNPPSQGVPTNPAQPRK
jgi:hypothetical protein